MKKKIIAILLVLSCSFAVLSAIGLDLSGDVGLGYMNYTITTVYNNTSLKENVKAGLSSSLGKGALTMDDPKSRDIYNALALGLSLQYSWLYTNLSVAFPFRQIPTGDDPLGEELKRLGAEDKINGSLIFDGQLGLGITLLKKTPLNIFVGGGLGFNYITTKRPLPQKYVDTIRDDKGKKVAKSLTEIRSIAMLGIGVDLDIKYYFTPNIGVSLDFKDTLYPIPLLNQRYYKGSAIDGGSFTYYITDDSIKNINKMIKYSWANNFVVRLGLAFKL